MELRYNYHMAYIEPTLYLCIIFRLVHLERNFIVIEGVQSLKMGMKCRFKKKGGIYFLIRCQPR